VPAEEATAIDVTLAVSPAEATVGDPLEVTLRLLAPPGCEPDPAGIGRQLGPFSVVSGAWEGPRPQDGHELWVWTGSVVAFRPGEHEIPALGLSLIGPEGERLSAQSPAHRVTIRSVLDPDEAEQAAQIADLKPPASLDPRYGAIWAAAGILAALLIGAAFLWWLHRRYAAKLAAAELPDDPFRRTPPHVWVYAELQKLLERRLAEQGQVELFFAELSGILKRYLTGRYRVELLERTSGEVPEALRQAGAPPGAIEDVARLLSHCDLVKFAKQRPDPSSCRQVIEEAYGIVDATKPREAEFDAEARGAA
jgi:hypothetical protein